MIAESRRKLLVLTSSFPYGAGEEFLESEVDFWPADKLDICVVPVGAPEHARRLPRGIGLDPRLGVYRTRWRKAAAVLVASVHVLLFIELLMLAKHRKLTLRRASACVIVISQTLLIRHGLRRLLAEIDGEVVVYSYWHSPSAYAAVLLKRSGHVRSVVARGHRGDIYEGLAPGGWLPLKRQLFPDIDHTWTVSEDGARELIGTFHGDAGRVSVARLGVDLPRRPGPEPEANRFHILSISSCTPMKQVPLIAKAVARLASAHPDVSFHWSHVGDGPGLASLREQVGTLESDRVNLSSWLPGQMLHTDVLAMLGERGFDVLVNASTSEGVPVSIMEAMAHGVPAIAPPVGGVGELVGGDDGWLLPGNASEASLLEALESALAERGATRRRQRAREKVASQFNADVNYRRFADDLIIRLQGPE